MGSGQMDLTQGSVWKQLVKYAAPLVISSLLQALYGIADMIVAGHFIGADGLSAINNATQVTLLITQVIIGLTTGGNILISQYFGAGDRENLKQTTVTLFSISMILGIALSAMFYFLAEPLLTVLKAPAIEEATAYMRICALGILFIFGYNALGAALRAVGNSRQPLYFIAITSAVNIVLDIIFVGPLKMGCSGAALATVIAQGISFLAALVYVVKKKELFGLTLRKLAVSAEKLKKILRLGIPCAVQMSVAGISWLSVTFLINDYGVFVSAGNGVSIKIKELCQLFIVAMANGATAMVAQNIGAGKYDRAKDVMYTAMKITLAMSLLLIAVVQLLAPQMVSLFTTDAATAEAAVKNLRIEIIGQIFYASFLVYHSLALGAGHTIFVFVSSFVNCILVRLTLAFLLNRYFGLTGIYIACMIAPASSIPLGLIYTRSNIWRRSLVTAGDT